MKVKICFDNGVYADSLILDGETIDEIRDKAYVEIDKRCWDERCCWSEIIEQ